MNPLARLFRRRPSSTLHVAVATHVIRRPIPLAKREPGPGECATGWCWWGAWDSGRGMWNWDWAAAPFSHDTHWLPASVDVLPVRCYALGVKP